MYVAEHHDWLCTGRGEIHSGRCATLHQAKYEALLQSHYRVLIAGLKHVLKRMSIVKKERLTG